MNFDRRFFNFEDPEVFVNMTGDDLKIHWKETFGFDFAASEDSFRKPEKYEHIRLIICALLLFNKVHHITDEIIQLYTMHFNYSNL